MKKKLAYAIQVIQFAIIAALVTSCSNKKTIDDGYYFQNFDDLKAWSKDAQVTNEAAHSGKYCTYTDSIHEFSQNFELDADYALSKGYKSAVVTAWCMKTTTDTKAGLVASIESPDQPSLPRESADFSKSLGATNTWIKVELHLKMQGQVPANSKIKVYVWSPGKEKAYMDDVQIQFRK